MSGPHSSHSEHLPNTILKVRKLRVEKTKISLVISSELESIIKLIETNIKKSGGSNSPFQNSSYNGGHKNPNYSLKSTSYNSKHGDNTKKGPSKSWRITKTKIVADNLSELDNAGLS